MKGKRRFLLVIVFVAAFGLIIIGESYIANRIIHGGIGNVTLKHLNSVLGATITVNIKEAFESISEHIPLNDYIPLGETNGTIQNRTNKIKTLSELITHRVINKIKQSELITHSEINKFKNKGELITQRVINKIKTRSDREIKDELITLINKSITLGELVTHRVINKNEIQSDLITQSEIHKIKIQDELITLINVNNKSHAELITQRVINKNKIQSELITQSEINKIKIQDELITLINANNKSKSHAELITQRVINKNKIQSELITQSEINNFKIKDELITLINVNNKSKSHGELITQRVINKNKIQSELITQREINKIHRQDDLSTLINVNNKIQDELITHRVINKINKEDDSFSIQHDFHQIFNTSNEETLPHYPIGTIPTDGIWQIVNGTLFKFFVYSAYYDKRDGRIIRIIGAIKTHELEQIWCRLWYSNKDLNSTNRSKFHSKSVRAEIQVIRKHYSASFIICPLKKFDMEKTPHSVSIVIELRDPPGNVLLIRNTDEDVKKMKFNNEDKIGICVKPFHNNYNQVFYLMEYIELNTILGISHFAFYNYKLGPQSSCVLKHYINGDITNNVINTTTDNDEENVDIIFKYNVSNNSSEMNNNSSTTTNNKGKLQSSFTQNVRPTVTMFPLDLRMRSKPEIGIDGLYAALNDCLYRNMYSYKYLALIDLDEFIMPRQNHTILDLLSSLNHRYSTRTAGSYSFQNGYFYLQFPDDLLINYKKISKNAELRASLITQRKTRRRLKVNTHTEQSRCICKAEDTVEVGNNFFWKLLPGKESLNVPADAGILHHYGICEFGGDDCIKLPSVIDRTAVKYMKQLVNRVNNVYNYLKKPCNLDNIPSLTTQPPKIPKRLKKKKKTYNATLETTKSKLNSTVTEPPKIV